MTRAILHVNPTPKPRQTRSDRWRWRAYVVRYREFADAVRAEAARAGVPLDGRPIGVVSWMPQPASRSRVRQIAMMLRPHRQRPDLDNLAKAILDALWPDDDSAVWSLALSKRWAPPGVLGQTSISW